MRLKLLVAYDGAPFAGWQSQASGKAVQDVLESALADIAGKTVTVHGAGRTDAGVHALGQCAHVDVPENLFPDEWQRALNARLPASLRILKSTKVGERFHARFSATGKTYRYVIFNAPVLPPHEAGRAWHVPTPLDSGELRRAADIFEGRHDFTAFSANRGGKQPDPMRTMEPVRIRRDGAHIALSFTGAGFLYKMVRMMTSAIVRAAQGKEPVDALAARLRDRGPRWNHVAPADGLYLVRVRH